MEPKENASELVCEFLDEQQDTDEISQAKRCALICVDEKIKTLELLELSIGGRQSGKTLLSKEWLRLQEVKQEIKKL